MTKLIQTPRLSILYNNLYNDKLYSYDIDHHDLLSIYNNINNIQNMSNIKFNMIGFLIYLYDDYNILDILHQDILNIGIKYYIDDKKYKYIYPSNKFNEIIKKLYNISSETIILTLKIISLNNIDYYEIDLLLFNEIIYKSMILNKIKHNINFNIDIFDHQFFKNFHILLKIMNNNVITYMNLNYNDYEPKKKNK